MKLFFEKFKRENEANSLYTRHALVLKDYLEQIECQKLKSNRCYKCNKVFASHQGMRIHQGHEHFKGNDKNYFLIHIYATYLYIKCILFHFLRTQPFCYI